MCLVYSKELMLMSLQKLSQYCILENYLFVNQRKLLVQMNPYVWEISANL